MMTLLIRNCAFLGVLLLVASQVQGFEKLTDYYERSEKNLEEYRSGKDIGGPVVKSDGVVLDLGDLNKETFPSLPRSIKLGIALSYKKLVVNDTTKGYDDMQSKLLQASFLQPEGKEVFKNDLKTISGSTKMRELNDWFSKFINDPDFLAAANLDAYSPFSMTRATMVMYETLKKACEKGTGERDIVNLSMLRFSSTESQMLRLHYVKVHGHFDCSSSESVTTVEYRKRVFSPYQSVIQQTKPEMQTTALAYIKGIFSKIQPKEERVTVPPIDSSAGSLMISSAVFTSSMTALLTATLINAPH